MSWPSGFTCQSASFIKIKTLPHAVGHISVTRLTADALFRYVEPTGQAVPRLVRFQNAQDQTVTGLTDG